MVQGVLVYSRWFTMYGLEEEEQEQEEEAVHGGGAVG